MNQTRFEVGDLVRLNHKFDQSMIGHIGRVVLSEFGWRDPVFVFVKPVNSKGKEWPPKLPFDPEPYWHFFPDEIELVSRRRKGG
jgi:hypothetical protein